MKTLSLFLLSFVLIVMCSCRGKTSSNITKEDVEKIINEKTPTGTPKSDVITFLITLKIGSRSVVGITSSGGRSEASWNTDSQTPNVHSHLNGVILNAGIHRDGFFTQSYYITMTFYFNEHEKLIGYHLYTFLDS